MKEKRGGQNKSKVFDLIEIIIWELICVELQLYESKVIEFPGVCFNSAFGKTK